MTLQTHTLDYHDDTTTYKAYYAYQSDTRHKRPAILIAHDWSGHNDFARQKANEIAALGYVGFALDMFGEGKIGHTKEEKSALIQPLLKDRAQLMARINCALKAVQTLEIVEANAIGAIGFCFGGLCVLDLARSGADVQGVVSFHGLLHAPEQPHNQPIHAKILALHGYDDPMVPPTQVLQFADEMTQARADWQLMMYGNTMHAFMNPEANDKNFGTVYEATTAKRAWIGMRDFFEELFKQCSN